MKKKVYKIIGACMLLALLAVGTRFASLCGDGDLPEFLYNNTTNTTMNG